MEYLSTFALIGGLYLLAAISPGPNFFIITQLSLDGNRSGAIAVAAGITTGSAIWAASAILGLAAVLHQIGWLATLLKLAGAAYLIWYGLNLLASSLVASPWSRPAAERPATLRSAYRTGLLTCLTNPKAGVFWTSVFAATLPSHAPIWVYVGCLIIVAALSAAWHFGLAIVFGSGRAQAAFGRIRRVLTAACGAALVGLGLRLGLAHDG